MSGRRIAIIGGTGLDRLEGLEVLETRTPDTPFGPPAGPLRFGRFAGCDVVFLARHGEDHARAPHEINYRANLRVLYDAGVTDVLAVGAVGSMDPRLAPGGVAVPDQLIDYTWGRAHSFSAPGEVLHVDFTQPYTPELRGTLVEAAGRAGVTVVPDGTYAATQGPRLETAAEIRRLERDGCHMVGMTGMPEAGLARELGLGYACLAVAVNWAAGKTRGDGIHAEIQQSLDEGMQRVRAILGEALAALARG